MKDHRNSILRARISNATPKILDVVETTLTTSTAAPQTARPPKAVARRQAANMLGLWRLCSRHVCHRAHVCRGEPSECLHYALPVLTPEMLQRLASPRPRKRWRAADAAR